MSEENNPDHLRARIAELEAELARVRFNTRRYDLLAASSGLMVYDYDVATGLISWSGNTLGVAGYENHELDGGVAEWEQYIHPDDRAGALELLGQAEAELGRYEVVYRFRHKAGHYVTTFDRGFFMGDDEGRATRMIGMMQDISDIQATLNDLKHAKERIDLLTAAAGLVVYEYDVAAGRLAWSGELMSVLGYTAADIDGPVESWSDRIHPDDHDEALKLFHAAQEAVGRYEVTYRFRRRDQAYVWLFDRGFFLPGPDGRAARMIGMMQDITARKVAEDEQARLRERIIDAQREALRELSTPLIPITDETVVMPIIGSIDSQRAQDVMEGLLHGVSRLGARVAIMDITGVPVVDTQVANALIQAAQAVRLLGAEVMLTGIRPEVAQTLVGLGVSLGEITTQSTLQAAIASVLRRARR